MKIRVLIAASRYYPEGETASEGDDHLQLDTNTVIVNYAKMYELTFRKRERQFFINVYSSQRRIYTINNKVVFLPANDPLLGVLSNFYTEHPRKYLGESSTHQLIIYNELFLPALKAVSVLNERGFINFDINRNQFAITSTIAGRVLQTWNDTNKSLPLARSTGYLLQIQSHQVEISSDSERPVHLDYYAFINYLRKHTTALTGPSISHVFMEKHERLFSIYADIGQERSNIRLFIRKAVEQYPHSTHVFTHLMEELITSEKNTHHAILATRLESLLVAECTPPREHSVLSASSATNDVPINPFSLFINPKINYTYKDEDEEKSYDYEQDAIKSKAG